MSALADCSFTPFHFALYCSFTEKPLVTIISNSFTFQFLFSLTVASLLSRSLHSFPWFCHFLSPIRLSLNDSCICSNHFPLLTWRGGVETTGREEWENIFCIKPSAHLTQYRLSCSFYERCGGASPQRRACWLNFILKTFPGNDAC